MFEVRVERFEEQPVASISTVAATAKQKSVRGGKPSKKKASRRKKRKHLLLEPYLHDLAAQDVFG